MAERIVRRDKIHSIQGDRDAEAQFNIEYCKTFPQGLDNFQGKIAI